MSQDASGSQPIKGIISCFWSIDRTETEQTEQLVGWSHQHFHHMAAASHTRWTEYVHKSSKNKDISGYIYQFKSASPTCACHATTQSIYVNLPSRTANVRNRKENQRNNTCAWKKKYMQREDWHSWDTFPFSTGFNPPLPPLRRVYLALKRSRLTVVNAATEKKLHFLLCLVSGALSSEEGGGDVCAIRKWILCTVKGWKAASGQTSKQDEGNLKL